jgi:hypothetical protein
VGWVSSPTDRQDANAGKTNSSACEEYFVTVYSGAVTGLFLSSQHKVILSNYHKNVEVNEKTVKNS